MIFYIVLFFLVFISSFFCTYTKTIQISNIFRYLCFVFMFLPSAFRFGIGTDYVNYVDVFNIIKSGGTVIQEPGWLLLNLLIIKLNLNVQWVFIISSFFTIFFMVKTEKNDFFVVIVLFYCLFYLDSYNIVRQALSMSICWYSYICYVKGKKIKSYLIAFTAIFFHFAAIVFLIMLLVMNFISFKSDVYFYFTFIIILLLFYTKLPEKILFYLLSFTKYSTYIENLEYYNQRAGGNTSILSIFVRSVIPFALLNTIKRKRCSIKEYSCLQLLTLALLFFDFFGVSFYIFQRIRSFFFLTYIALMKASFIKNNSIATITNYFYLFFFIAYYFLLRLLSGSGEIIPYTSIFR